MIRVRNNWDVLLFVLINTSIVVIFVYAGNILRHGENVDWRYLSASLFNSVFLGSVMSGIGAWSMKKNHILSQKLKELVERDRLTGAATRDHFYHCVKLHDLRMGVAMMVDVDHFKKVNDTYGHLAGDEVLRRVGEVLRRMVRRQDIVCRFGGEEFAIFLRDISVADADTLANRIREGLAAQLIVDEEGRTIQVTASFGVAAGAKMQTLDEALKFADVALYQAKLGGRNRVVLSPGAEPRVDRRMAAPIGGMAAAG